MAELSRYGHRQRMRDAYIAGDMRHSADHNLLELYISLIIPQKDVKPIAYELFNTFGSLERILNASVEELMMVKGVGQSTAVGISLINEINHRVLINRNNNAVLSSTDAATEYCKNLLFYETVENLYIISLDCANNVIRANKISSGTAASIDVSIRELVDPVILDKAVSVIITHNHTSDVSTPSLNDINFTMKAISTFSKLNIKVLDHIIVSKSTCFSMRNNNATNYLFNSVR